MNTSPQKRKKQERNTKVEGNTMKVKIKANRYARNKFRRSVILSTFLMIAAVFVLGVTFIHGATLDSDQIFEANKTHVIKVSRASLEKRPEQPKELIVVSRGGRRVLTINEVFIYNNGISMPREHQEYLYNLCKSYGLDYVKTLSLLKHESQFDQNAFSGTNDYGYMQINKINHDHLAATLGTKNRPLDPYINIKWGTYMLNAAYETWSKEGKTGDDLDTYAWSTYNKGLGGVRKTGKAKTYVSKVYSEYNLLSPFYK